MKIKKELGELSPDFKRNSLIFSTVKAKFKLKNWIKCRDTHIVSLVTERRSQFKESEEIAIYPFNQVREAKRFEVRKRDPFGYLLIFDIDFIAIASVSDWHQKSISPVFVMHDVLNNDVLVLRYCVILADTKSTQQVEESFRFILLSTFLDNMLDGRPTDLLIQQTLVVCYCRGDCSFCHDVVVLVNIHSLFKE